MEVFSPTIDKDTVSSKIVSHGHDKPNHITLSDKQTPDESSTRMSPFTLEVQSLNKDLDYIEKMIIQQDALREALNSQSDYLQFIDNRFEQLDNLAKDISTKKQETQQDVQQQENVAHDEIVRLDQKIDKLIADNETKQNSLEVAIRELITILKQKNDKITEQPIAQEKIPTVIKQMINNVEDLNEFKTLDVDPQKINEQKQHIQQRIQTNIQQIDDNKEELVKTKQMLDQFKDDYEKTLHSILDNSPTKDKTSKTNQKHKELKILKNNQLKIKETLDTGKTECKLKATRSNLGRKQQKIAGICTQLNKQKLKQLNMIDDEVRKHIQVRRRYTKRYTNQIMREMQILRRKVARKNVDLAMLLEQL